jgi:hypothetical protein
MYLPMFLESIRRIQKGEKTTTLRSLKYNYVVGEELTLEGTDICIRITERQQVTIPDDLTPEIARGEGYESVQAMVDALKARYRGNYLTRQWLYTFVVVTTKAPVTKSSA